MESWINYKGKRCLLISKNNKIIINQNIIKLQKDMELKYKFYNGIIKGFYLNGDYIQFDNPNEAKNWHDYINTLLNIKKE